MATISNSNLRQQNDNIRDSRGRCLSKKTLQPMRKYSIRDPISKFHMYLSNRTSAPM
jgi:hypothetical protein